MPCATPTLTVAAEDHDRFAGKGVVRASAVSGRRDVRWPGRVGMRRRHALDLDLDVPSVIVLPIDYSVDIAISAQLGEERVTRT